MTNSNVTSSLLLVLGSLVFSGTVWGQPRQFDAARPNGNAGRPPAFGGALLFDAPVDNRQPPGQPVIIETVRKRGLVTPPVDFRQGLTQLLDDHLQKRIDLIDRDCSLTEDQKQKLQLAGKGDIHRVVGQISQVDRDPESEADDATTLLTASLPFRSVFDSSPPNDGTLFAKVSRRILTVDQFAAYERLIVPPPVPAVDQSKQKGVLVNLRSFEARPVAMTIKQLFNDKSLVIESKTTSMLIIVGSQAQVETCVDLLQQLEQPAPLRRLK